MFAAIFSIFIIIPIVEVWLFLTVGSIIGVIPTIMITVVTALVGANLARQEGFQIFMKVQQKLNKGEVPGNELIQGLMVLIGGITLLTPGFFTDFLGLTLLIPFTRSLYISLFSKHFKGNVRFENGDISGKIERTRSDDVFDNDDFNS